MNAIHPNLSQTDFGGGQSRPSLQGRSPLLVAGLSAAALVFAVLLMAYGFFRAQLQIPMPHLPWTFWPSTIVLVGASLLLQQSARSARAGKGNRAHHALLSSTALGFLFVGLQAPGIVMLGQLNMPFRALSVTLYGLTIALIGLHLLLTVGALAAMSEASLQSERHHYERRDAARLDRLATYFHVMTALWIVVFAMLVLVNW